MNLSPVNSARSKLNIILSQAKILHVMVISLIAFTPVHSLSISPVSLISPCSDTASQTKSLKVLLKLVYKCLWHYMNRLNNVISLQLRIVPCKDRQ